MDLALLVAPIAADLGEEIGSHVYWGNAPEAGALYSGVLHIDTVISTLAVMAILIGAALYLRSRITSGVPGPLQNALEAVIGYIDDAAGDQVGPKRRASIAPLAVTLALFIAISNWIGLVPTGGLFKSPTADLNTTLALALVTVGWVQFSSIKSRGLGGYFGHFFKPFKLLAPINVIEEDRQAYHPGLPTFRQHRRRRDHAGGDRQPARRVADGTDPQPALGGLQPVRRRRPGLHLHDALHRLLWHRHGAGGALNPSSGTRKAVNGPRRIGRSPRPSAPARAVPARGGRGAMRAPALRLRVTFHRYSM